MKTSTHITLLATCCSLALAGTAAAGPLGGHSSQGEPVIGKVGKATHKVALTVAYDESVGGRIDSLLIPWTSECKSGDWVWNTANIAGPLDSAGAFTASLDPPSFDYGDGKHAVSSESLSGKITKSGASGNWRVQTNIVDVS